MICKYAEIFCWKNVSSFCSAKATHIFSAKNIRILYIKSAKTVNEMTLNELVKLTTLWTTGPCLFLLAKYLINRVRSCLGTYIHPPTLKESPTAGCTGEQREFLVWVRLKPVTFRTVAKYLAAQLRCIFNSRTFIQHQISKDLLWRRFWWWFWDNIS